MWELRLSRDVRWQLSNSTSWGEWIRLSSPPKPSNPNGDLLRPLVVGQSPSVLITSNAICPKQMPGLAHATVHLLCTTTRHGQNYKQACNTGRKLKVKQTNSAAPTPGSHPGSSGPSAIAGPASPRSHLAQCPPTETST